MCEAAHQVGKADEAHSGRVEKKTLWSKPFLHPQLRSEPSSLTCACGQPLSHVQQFVTPWTAAGQASLSFAISQSLLKFMSIE